MDSDEHVIVVDGLRRRYGPPGPAGFEAMRGVSLTVARGEIFALLGVNGAGKTSTVELLAGLDRPSDGRVRVLGCDPYRERARLRPRTGVMLQEGGFPADLTVAETLRLWAACTTGARPVAEALAMVDLDRRRTVRVKQLSGGERRRLDLAVALLGRPEVLFLDEPTTGLDAESRRTTWDLVRDLRDDGTTVLLTTHYLEEAEELADRLAIMRRGRIVVSGTPAQVRARRPSRIRFRLPAGVSPDALPAALPATVTGDRVEVRTRRLQPVLLHLLRWAEERGVELAELDARAPSLEETFLDIAQHGPAEDEPARHRAGNDTREVAVG